MLLFPAVLLWLLSACRQHFPVPANETVYLRQVGDIPFDAQLDDPAFKVCNENTARQYYNFGKGLMYRGEKVELKRFFQKNFRAQKGSKESGYVTVRFIVNCEGKTGMFRIMQIGRDFQVKHFSKNLVSQLSGLVAQLDGWIVGEQDGKTFDYYQYLTFKIEDGTITEILP